MKKNMAMLIFMVSIFILISCEKEEIQEIKMQIETLNSKLDSSVENIDAHLNNQTSLFYKMIGEQLPVIIPDKYKIDIKNLSKYLDSVLNDLNDENLGKAIDLYISIIKSAPPWIQEASSDEILFSKYTIDYLTILNNYRKNNDISEVVSSLQTFIMTSNDYKNINLVIEKYNSLVDEQNNQYSLMIQNLNKSMSTAFSNPDIKYDDLAEILKKVEPYIKEDALSENIKLLDDYLAEADDLEKLTMDVESLSKQLNDIEDNKVKNELYNIFIERLALYSYKANKLRLLDNTNVLTKINSCMEKIASYEESVKRMEEQTLLDQITESLQICKNEIQNLNSNITSNSMISVLATQLASLKYNALNLNLLDNTSVITEIQNCVNLLSKKEELISKEIISKSQTDLKTYNSRALNRINSVKTGYDNIGIFDNNKTNKKISFLISLEEIQVSYLYPSINMLYQQVYQEIWNSLDAESKFQVSRASLNTNKKELYDYF